MPPRAHPREHHDRIHNYFFPKSKLSSGHVVEHVLHVVTIIINILYIYASWCFFSFQTEANVEIGDSIFFLGSLWVVLTTVHSMIESKFRFSRLLSYDGKGEAEEYRDESLENICFVLGSFLFMVGALFYFPPLTKGLNEKSKHKAEAAGAWLFVFGSLLNFLAAFFNAIGASAHPGERKPGSTKWWIHYIRQIALLISQLGSAVYILGSLLYRPGFGKCASESKGESICLNIGDAGTQLYVVGSVFYLVESILGYTCTWLNMLEPCPPWEEDDDDSDE